MRCIVASRLEDEIFPTTKKNLRERTEYPTELRLARNRVERRHDEHQPHLHLPFCCHSLSPFITLLRCGGDLIGHWKTVESGLEGSRYTKCDAGLHVVP